MNNTGRNKKSGYLVALLLMVGLAAFSNSMRELAEIHQFTINTSRLIAEYVVPAEMPQTPQIPQVIVAKLESCNSKSADELPWLEDVEGITEPGGVAVTVPAKPVSVEKAERRVRIKPTDVQLAKLNKWRPFDFEPGQFEFRVSTDDNEGSAQTLLPSTLFKAKNRKHNVIRLNPRDREMILKTLNRSINLRTAS
ncbi:MAG TPA: hypothetical protein VFI24_05805 [Pyrinomonadaceae bacterium]|nr:hypothetical protein [Pyrinomonadaceae bacterium]